MKLTEQAEVLLKKRYLHSGETCWEDVAQRVSKAMANDSKQAELFYSIIEPGLFLPNTPALANAGKPNGQYCACFLLPVEDSIASIFETLQHVALVSKSGGGVGINFSSLRPEGDIVGTTQGISSGPISFMKVYNEAINQLRQGGIRRGAAMGLLSIDHPDIVKFIKCKNRDKDFSNFNISAAVTNSFMFSLRDHPYTYWTCKFGNTLYHIDRKTSNPISEHTAMSLEEQDFYTVSEIWDLLVAQAHKNGEPGIVFWDVIRQEDQTIQGVNACSELPLEPYGACVLGSIDVSKFVNQNYEIDQHRLIDVVKIAVDFLNNVIDKTTFPIQQITDVVYKSRRIGLGIMGWADLLLKLGIRYGSEHSFALAQDLMKLINDTASSRSHQQGYNNKTVTCIAPTGSISTLAGCSSGIEPNFAWVTKHTREDFDPTTVFHPLVEDINNLPTHFVKASDVTPEEHVKMQAAFQAYVESAVSKTVNLPRAATPEDVDEIYRLAYDLGCKGITVYRDGSRAGQVLTDAESSTTNLTERPDLESPYNETEILDMEALRDHLGLNEPRPEILEGFIFKVQVELDGKVENVYVPIGVLEGRPYEIFVEGNIRGVSPGFAQFMDGLTRMTSLCLRWGIPLGDIVAQLEKIPEQHMFSMPHKIADILKQFIPEEDNENIGQRCPECGEVVRFESGCVSCSCGWSHCQ